MPASAEDHITLATHNRIDPTMRAPDCKRDIDAPVRRAPVRLDGLPSRRLVAPCYPARSTTCSPTRQRSRSRKGPLSLPPSPLAESLLLVFASVMVFTTTAFDNLLLIRRSSMEYSFKIKRMELSATTFLSMLHLNFRREPHRVGRRRSLGRTRLRRVSRYGSSSTVDYRWNLGSYSRAYIRPGVFNPAWPVLCFAELASQMENTVNNQPTTRTKYGHRLCVSWTHCAEHSGSRRLSCACVGPNLGFT